MKHWSLLNANKYVTDSLKSIDLYIIGDFMPSIDSAVERDRNWESRDGGVGLVTCRKVLQDSNQGYRQQGL